MSLGIKSLSLVYLFIIRLRFPASKSIAQIIRQRYGERTLKLQRRLERTDFKLQKARLDADFLTKCQEHELIPHFLFFHTANVCQRSSSSYASAQRRFLQDELNEKKSAIRRLSNEFAVGLANLRDSVSLLDFTHLSGKLAKSNTNSLHKQRQIQEKNSIVCNKNNPRIKSTQRK